MINRFLLLCILAIVAISMPKDSVQDCAEVNIAEAAEARRKKPKDTLYISPSLTKYVTEFRIEAFKREMDVDADIDNFVSDIVSVDYLKYPMLGLYLREEHIIFINENTKMDDKIVRRVLFHELGHALTNPVLAGGSHSCVDCGEIMAQHSPTSFSYLHNNEVWQSEVDVLFKWIKTNRRIKID